MYNVNFMKEGCNMKSNTNAITTRSQIRYISITAIFAALITIMTAYVFHIPVPATGGYIHLGDSLIYLAATILPTPYAFAAGAIGGGMADLLTAPMWTLPTVFIKMLITIPFSNKGTKIITGRNVIAPIFAYLISGTGYFLANNLLFHSGIAFLTSFGGSAIQSLGSGIVFVVFGTTLDKIGFKKRLNIETK